jgi:hypothetical protein
MRGKAVKRLDRKSQDRPRHYTAKSRIASTTLACCASVSRE